MMIQTIIITNNDLTNNPTPHQQAVLDRIHVMNADLNKSDFKIFNTYLTQEYLNKNPLELLVQYIQLHLQA